MAQNKMLAMILAGGRGTRLEGLTKKVAKPAVAYGGKYRIIDFPLSNCANSGIDVVGVLTGLEESAKLDGANDMLLFVKIVLPLSMPVVATIALFNGVWHWNDYFTGVMYISKAELQPIQPFLYRIVARASASKAVVAMPAGISAQQVSSQSVRLATMVVTTFPIMCVYPFLQKYFVKGMMVGSIKG